MKGNIRHFFLGGNTSKGFYSFYRYILSQDIAKRIICIKGGPGTGKSSLMKKIGEFFNKKGYDIEYHHCSSDSDSIDGVVIKGLNVALLDGTAPHITDPINPGVVDEILNLGDFLNENRLKKHKDTVISLNTEIGKTFKRAYRYLEAAKAIQDDWETYNYEALDISKLNLFKENLKNEVFHNVSISTLGNSRHLFATAFTPKGIVTYIDSIILNCEKVYVLNGEPGTGKTNILSFIHNEAIKRGLYVEVYHNPLIPEKLEHLLIPSLNTAFLTSNELNKKSFTGKQIFMDNFLDKSIINKNSKEIYKDKEVFYLLLNKSLEIIALAKKLHDRLEEYYITNMDFNKLQDKLDTILDKILSYEKEYKNKNKIQ